MKEKEREVNDFIYGTQYYRAPTPMPEEWEMDIPMIKEMGFNIIQLRPQWRWHEKIKGKFYWDDLDKLFDLAEKHGLYIVFKFMLETAPAWLYREYDCERVNLLGTKIIPGAIGAMYVGGWLPCFDHPKVREEANRFIEAAVKRYKDRKNLLLWNAWNEPRSRPIHECCCEESKKSYRRWLKEKFGSIEKLNQFLGKAWGDWEDIDPPGMVSDYAEMYLWRQWAMWSVADRLRWMYEEIRKHDKEHPIITHVGGCSVIQDVAGDSSLDWLNAKQVDFYGSSFPVLPEHNTPSLYHQGIASMICDWIRSISPYFWINELYPNSYNWKEEVKVEELRRWIWTTVAHGAKGILFWQYRAERLGKESNANGLVNIDGSKNERSEEVERIGKVIGNHASIFRKSRVPQSEVAILYDHHSDLISRIENTPPISSSKFNEGVTYPYKFSLHGSYCLFWNNDIPVDWIPSQEIERIRRYRVVYLPIPYIIDKKMAEELTRFVEGGGILISEGSLGLRGENTWVNLSVPPFGLDKLFGCKEAGRLAIKEPRILSADKYGIKIPATRMMTWLEVKEAEVIGKWENGRAAMTISRYGKGKAILVGMYPGAAYIDTRDKILIRFIRLLLEEAGVKPPVELEGVKGRVYTRMLVKEKERLIFLFNYGNQDEEITITSPRINDAKDLCQVAKLSKDNKGNLHISLPAGEVACIWSRA
ncbi:beta-galactosidase [Candidatus Calescamantes bacterium]|nr:beta-galactosidase [Candidatus Calescamantes bacterium]